MNFSGPSSGWSGSAPFPTDSDYRQFANSPDPSSPEFPLRALSQTPFHLRRPDSGLLWAQSPVVGLLLNCFKIKLMFSSQILFRRQTMKL